MNLTDAEGNVTKTYTYDAFGVEKNIDSSDTNAFRYCGEYYDSETGTIYLRARYYNPTTGRFISRDSFAGRRSDPLSLNLYTYCANNPIVYIDPSGHNFLEDVLDYIFNPMTAFAPSPDEARSYVIYASYNKSKKDKSYKENPKQAEIIKKLYEDKYSVKCTVYSVDSAEEFVNTWNSLDDSNGINEIQVISHGKVTENGNGYLYFKDGSKLFSSSSSATGLTNGNKSIDNIQSKNVNSIYFSACNTANPDFNSNIADAFFNKNTAAKSVTGWDGGVYFVSISRKAFFKFSSFIINKDFPSKDQDTFNMWKSGEDDRKPGKVIKTR